VADTLTLALADDLRGTSARATQGRSGARSRWRYQAGKLQPGASPLGCRAIRRMALWMARGRIGLVGRRTWALSTVGATPWCGWGCLAFHRAVPPPAWVQSVIRSENSVPVPGSRYPVPVPLSGAGIRRPGTAASTAPRASPPLLQAGASNRPRTANITKCGNGHSTWGLPFPREVTSGLPSTFMIYGSRESR